MKYKLDLTDLPEIRVAWIRGREHINLKKPCTILNLGKFGSGKSTLLESLSLRFLEDGRVYDLFGSRDNEGLAWGRIFPKNELLFVTGDSVEIKGRWHMTHVKDCTLRVMRKYSVVLSVSAFYSDLEEEFHGLNQIIHRNLYKKTYWKHPEFVMVREGANYLYARLSVGKNQDQAKADYIYLLRESRHMGYTMGVDTIRWTSIDKEIRDVADLTFIKRIGVHGLPHDIRFIYSFIDPPSMMNFPAEGFVLLSGRGPIGIGKFDYVPWHKKEKDDLLSELGLRNRIQYGEVPDYGDAKRGWLSDQEHGEIISLRSEDKSMHLIAEEKHRSPKTVMDHIHNHNRGVRKRGYCTRCRRIKGAYAGQEV